MEAFDLNFLLDEIEIDKEISLRGYREFIKLAWRWVEPSQPFKHNWHIDAIADHLEAIAKGEIKRLVINIPPASTKSLSVSVMFPAWVWTIQPGKRFIYGSYNDDLALRDAKRCRRLIDSDWYQQRWGNVFKPHWSDNWEAGRFSNDQGGSRKTTSIAGGVTGEHADIQIADDPHKPYDLTGSLSIAEKSVETVLEWWASTMATRATDITKTARVVMMQRLAANDLAGKMIDTGLYELLCLPMEYESKRKCFTSIGFEDPRKEEGEILDLNRWPQKALEDLKIELGPRACKAQLQQDPAPKEGTIFKVKHFQNRYDDLPVSYEAFWLQSWDCTFNNQGDSYVSGQIWCADKGSFYKVDRIRERLTFMQTVRAIKSFMHQYPQATIILIEKKANGDAIIDYLEEKNVRGLVPITPKESKASRAHAVEPMFEMGRIWLPKNEFWVEEYITEMLHFTGDKSEVNDQVDATSQALLYFLRHQSDKVKNALSKMNEYAKYI